MRGMRSHLHRGGACMHARRDVAKDCRRVERLLATSPLAGCRTTHLPQRVTWSALFTAPVRMIADCSAFMKTATSLQQLLPTASWSHISPWRDAACATKAGTKAHPKARRVLASAAAARVAEKDTTAAAAPVHGATKLRQASFQRRSMRPWPHACGRMDGPTGGATHSKPSVASHDSLQHRRTTHETQRCIPCRRA